MNQDVLMVGVSQVWGTGRTRGVGKRRPSYALDGVTSLRSRWGWAFR